MKTIQSILAESPDATNAEILAAIEASREYRRVPVAEVKLWLLANNLLGTLIVIRDTTDILPLKGGLSEFLSGLSLYESIDATDPTILIKAQGLTQALAGSGIITADQLASFLDLMKEPTPYATEADIAAARLTLAKDDRLAVFETYASGFRDAVNAAATVGELPEVPQ